MRTAEQSIKRLEEMRADLIKQRDEMANKTQLSDWDKAWFMGEISALGNAIYVIKGN